MLIIYRIGKKFDPYIHAANFNLEFKQLEPYLYNLHDRIPIGSTYVSKLFELSSDWSDEINILFYSSFKVSTSNYNRKHNIKNKFSLSHSLF